MYLEILDPMPQMDIGHIPIMDGPGFPVMNGAGGHFIMVDGNMIIIMAGSGFPEEPGLRHGLPGDILLLI